MPTPEIPRINDRQEEFNVPESLKSEIQAIETNPKSTITADGGGQPVISQTPQDVKIQLPGDEKALWQIAKRSINDALSWLARFTIRIMDIKKLKNQEGGNNANSK